MHAKPRARMHTHLVMKIGSKQFATHTTPLLYTQINVPEFS